MTMLCRKVCRRVCRQRADMKLVMVGYEWLCSNVIVMVGYEWLCYFSALM